MHHIWRTSTFSPDENSADIGLNECKRPDCRTSRGITRNHCPSVVRRGTQNERGGCEAVAR